MRRLILAIAAGVMLASPAMASSAWYPCPTLKCQQERDLRLGPRAPNRGPIPDGRDRWVPFVPSDFDPPVEPILGGSLDPIFGRRGIRIGE